MNTRTPFLFLTVSLAAALAVGCSKAVEAPPAVVPEITLTWDAGVADAVARRLLFPPYPPEH